MIVLTVVGVSDSRVSFEEQLEARLAEGFVINNVIPLTVENDVRKFLAYVVTEEEDVNPDIPAAMVEAHEDIGYETAIHNSAEEAGEFAHENYGEEAYSTFTDPIRSDEIYQRDIFFALINIGDMNTFRARLDGKPVVALCHFAVGNRPNDAIATPMAILVDDDLASRLDLPVKTSYERKEG